MDPIQRNSLEVGYSVLMKAGWNRKRLRESEMGAWAKDDFWLFRLEKLCEGILDGCNFVCLRVAFFFTEELHLNWYSKNLVDSDRLLFDSLVSGIWGMERNRW